MNESRLSYVKKDIIWAGVSNVFYTVFPFVIRTVFIRNLGSEYLGLNSLCTSIIYVFSVADLGVSNAFVFRLYKPVALHDTKEACGLLNFYRKVYTLIGTIIFTVGLFILPFLDKLIKEDVPKNINIYLVFLIYLVNTVVSYAVFAYKELILIANQHRDYVDMIGCLFLSIMYCIQIGLIIHKNYYGFLIVMPLATIFANVTKSIVAKKKYPDYTCKGKIHNEHKTRLLHDVFSVAIYKFRDVSRNASDSIIISAFLGLAVLSNYQNYYTVLTVPLVLRFIFVNAVAPSMGNCIATENEMEVYDIYKVFAFFYIYVTGWFAICYGGLIQDFIAMWLGKNYILSSSIVWLLVIYYYVLGYCDQTKMFREAAGLWNKGRMFAGIEMFSNLILNIGLVYFLGLGGIVLATILTILFVNIPFENYIIFGSFFHHGIWEIVVLYIKSFVWFVATGYITQRLCNCIACEEKYIGIALKAVVCFIVPIVSFLIINYKADEFKYIVQRLGW